MTSSASEGSGALQGQNAYQRLVDEIRRGELRPGTRLREIELAERFGISRTPIREAIRRLEADGLIAHAPRHGAVVKALTRQEAMELYDMRVVLEGTAARMAARHASDLQVAELEDLNAEMASRLEDGAGLYRLNRQFHWALLNAAKNRYLIKSMEALSKTLLILGPTTLTERHRAQEAVAEHARIVDAVRRHDQAAAEKEMRAHIEAAQQVRLKVLRRLDPDPPA